jgi:hypothetical protein
MVCNVNGTRNSGAAGARWVRQEIAGVTLRNGNRIVDFYGWLYGVSTQPTSDPDWHLSLGPDPEWANEAGIELATFVKVGDILFGHNPRGRTPLGSQSLLSKWSSTVGRRMTRA